VAAERGLERSSLAQASVETVSRLYGLGLLTVPASASALERDVAPLEGSGRDCFPTALPALPSLRAAAFPGVVVHLGRSLRDVGRDRGSAELAAFRPALGAFLDSVGASPSVTRRENAALPIADWRLRTCSSAVVPSTVRASDSCVPSCSARLRPPLILRRIYACVCRGASGSGARVSIHSRNGPSGRVRGQTPDGPGSDGGRWRRGGSCRLGTRKLRTCDTSAWGVSGVRPQTRPRQPWPISSSSAPSMRLNSAWRSRFGRWPPGKIARRPSGARLASSSATACGT
jgi:hypothetical protein